MRARILCGVLVALGCGSNDPVASEHASSTTRGPTQGGHVAMSPVRVVTQLDRPAYAIAIDHDNVYFTTNVASSLEPKPNVVWQCSKDGCAAPTPIASGHAMPDDIAVDATNVYWLGANATQPPKSILSCPIGGCGGADPRVVVFQDPILDIASDGTTLSWLGSGTVRACDGSNCDATTRVVVSDTDALQIAIDAPNLWFRDFDESIRRCTIADCGSTQRRVATGFGFTPFAVDQTNVYFRTPAGISRCAKTGCRKPAVIAALDADASVTDIAADGARVYWIDRQSVRACPIAGCARPTIIAPGGPGIAAANRLAIDEAFVYWTAGDVLGTMTTDKVDHHGPGAIFRVAK